MVEDLKSRKRDRARGGSILNSHLEIWPKKRNLGVWAIDGQAASRNPFCSQEQRDGGQPGTTVVACVSTAKQLRGWKELSDGSEQESLLLYFLLIPSAIFI